MCLPTTLECVVGISIFAIVYRFLSHLPDDVWRSPIPSSFFPLFLSNRDPICTQMKTYFPFSVFFNGNNLKYQKMCLKANVCFVALLIVSAMNHSMYLNARTDFYTLGKDLLIIPDRIKKQWNSKRYSHPPYFPFLQRNFTAHSDYDWDCHKLCNLLSLKQSWCVLLAHWFTYQKMT